MIKLNYFVRFVAFQAGFLPSSSWGLAAPFPSHPSDKEIAGSSFCLQSERPRKEEKEGKVRNVFIRELIGLLKPCYCTPASAWLPSPLPAEISGGKGGKGEGKEWIQKAGKCCCSSGCCAGPVPRKMRLIELWVCREQSSALGMGLGQVGARS